jgi:hypothetical protein
MAVSNPRDWQASIQGPGNRPGWSGVVKHLGQLIHTCSHAHPTWEPAMECAREVADRARARNVTSPNETI